jgi:hypothetical protein
MNQNRTHTSIIHLSLSAALVIGFGGCAAQRMVTKAEPTPFLASTGHAGPEKSARLPFERVWREADLDTAHYSKIVLRPVTTAYLRTNIWWESESTFVMSEHAFHQHVGELASYWDGSLARAFQAPKNRFAVTTEAGQPGTLVMEIAITEAVFGHPAANAGSYAVTGGGAAYTAMLTPSVAFEARVTDGATGKLLATASDRTSTKIKVIGLDKFSFTKSNREICDEWSEEIMEAFNKELFPKVKRPWIGIL